MIKRHGRRTPQTTALVAAMREAHYWRWRHKRAMLALEACREARDGQIFFGRVDNTDNWSDWLDVEDDDDQG